MCEAELRRELVAHGVNPGRCLVPRASRVGRYIALLNEKLGVYSASTLLDGAHMDVERGFVELCISALLSPERSGDDGQGIRFRPMDPAADADLESSFVML